MVYVLILHQSHILILSKLRCSMVGVAQTKKAREGNEIHLVVLAFCGPMDNVNGTARVFFMVIGSIKLTGDLIVLMLPKRHQVG